MRIDSRASSIVGLASLKNNSLVSSYYKAQQAQARQNSAVSSARPASISSDDLKAQLLNLASRLDKFTELTSPFVKLGLNSNSGSGAGGAASGTGGTEGTGGESGGTDPAPVTPDRVTVSVVDGGRRTGKFAKQVFKALRQGFSSENQEVLRNGSLSGTLQFTIGEGETAKSFTVGVNGSTTAQDLVSEFNAKAGGRAQASFINSGSEEEPRLRIKISTVVGEQPPAEEPPAEGDPAGSSGSEIGDSGLLGSGSLSFDALQNNAAEISRDLKNFVESFNRLVDLVKKAQEEDGDLSQSAVDEQALFEVQNALQEAKSEDGSVRFDSFLNSRGDGKLQFNANEFDRVYLDNAGGTVEALRELALSVTGREGVVRQFVASNGAIDRAMGALGIDPAPTAIRKVDETEQKNLSLARDQADKLDSFVSRLRTGEEFLSSLGV